MSSSYIPFALDGSSLGGPDIKALNSHFLNESGDTMRGDLGMNNHQIKNVAEAIDDSDVVNKKQVNKEVHAVEEKIIKTTTNEMESFKSKLTEIVKDVDAKVELVKKGNDIIEKNLKKEIKELQSQYTSLETSIKKELNSDKHINETIKRHEEFKKHQGFDIINRKYFLFAGKKDFLFNLINYNKRLTEKKYMSTNEGKTIIFKANIMTTYKTFIIKEFTFFLVFKYIPSTIPIISNLIIPTIITGKTEPKGIICGFDNKVVINNQLIHPGKSDYEIHVSALMNIGTKHVVYFNEHLEWKDYSITEGFTWGQLNLGGVDAHVYDFIIYDTKMMRDEIKTIINILAKFHNVPQKITNLEDKVLKMEDDIKDFKELFKV